MDSALVTQAGPLFTSWQRSLAVRPQDLEGEEDRLAHTQRQQTLMDALDRGAETLSRYLREHLGLDADTPIGAPVFPREALSPRELREMPAELEVELAEVWSENISAADASKPLFWLLAHLDWLEQGRVGADRMHAYFTEGGGREDTLDARTRTFLRRTGGLPHVRGNVSVLTDCPLARAWWRVMVASEVSSDPAAGLTRAQSHDVLRSAGQVWNELAQMGVHRTTAVNHPRARAAIIAEMAEHGNLNQALVRRIAQGLARASMSRSLAHIPWEELRSITMVEAEAVAPA